MDLQPFDRRQIAITPMSRQEVDVAVDWARQEGWNPGIHDAECFYSTDMTGFYATRLKGEIVGTISIVKYPQDFAFVGFIIVRPDLRGKGIGTLMYHFMQDSSKGFTAGLDGVLQMQATYERLGFKFAHKNIRYAGTAKGKLSPNCVLIREADFEAVVDFDAKHFFTARPAFLRCWLYQKDAHAYMVQNQVGEICGYGVIRKCFVGHKVGPLFADTHEAAAALLDSLMSTVVGQEVFLDVPEPNTSAVTLAEKLGMKPVFSTVRMYTKQAPNLPLENIYGITSFELE
jgi:ribosomal protein S18 acetylase RimI-like enzyme